MASQYRLPAASEEWSSAEWEKRWARAAAYLATDPKWVVGPAVVAMYATGMLAAEARERDAG